MAQVPPLKLDATGVFTRMGGDTVAVANLATGTANASTFVRGDGTWAIPVTAVPDGDKGDIVVSASGVTWTIDAGVVTYAKMQNVSATNKLLGRSTAGAGVVEEIACTAAGRALIDDATAADQRTTLGLGTGDSPTFVSVDVYNPSASSLAGFTAHANTTAIAGFRTYGSSMAGSAFGVPLANLTLLYSDGAASTGLGIGTGTATPLIFATSGAERARLTPAGDLGLGTVSPDSYSGYVGATLSSTTGAFVFCKSTTGSMTAQLIADNNEGAVQVGSRTNHNVFFQTNNTTRATLSATGLAVVGDLSDGKGDVRLIPQNSKSADYTTVLADAGKHIFHPTADTTARAWTIAANSSVAYPVGTAITFVNQAGAGFVYITCSDTLRLAGTAAAGTLALAANGMATALKITSTEWIISGAGIT